MGFLGISLPLGAEIVIIIVGVAYTLLSVFLQRKLTNPKRMREVQARLKQITTELNTLMKNNGSKEEISERNKEIVPLMKESMQTQMKPMLVILPLFIVIYYVLLPAIPLGLTAAEIATKNVQFLFFVTALVFGFAASGAVLLYDRKLAKKEAAQNAEPAMNNNTI